jgi:hypothetical protein
MANVDAGSHNGFDYGEAIAAEHVLVGRPVWKSHFARWDGSIVHLWASRFTNKPVG